MSNERNVIQSTEYPNHFDSLVSCFMTLGLESGQVILVHSSLSQIGWTIGGARTVIDALLSVAGESGTIVMPSFTASNSDPGGWENPPVPNDWFETICQNMPPFDKEKSATEFVGVIPELFRTYPKTRRSNHPQSSFIANGKYSSQILETHALTPSFGMDSPLGALYRLNADALMIGVGYENCTALHLAEVLSGRTKTKRSGTALMRDGKREWVWFDEPDWNSDDFGAVGAAFEAETDLVVSGTIGRAASKIVPIRKLVDFAADYFKMKRLR